MDIDRKLKWTSVYFHMSREIKRFSISYKFQQALSRVVSLIINPPERMFYHAFHHQSLQTKTASNDEISQAISQTWLNKTNKFMKCEMKKQKKPQTDKKLKNLPTVSLNYQKEEWNCSDKKEQNEDEGNKWSLLLSRLF